MSTRNEPLSSPQALPKVVVPADKPLWGLELKAASVLCLVFSIVGILLRLERYALGRSFRNDEATLATAINTHSLQSIFAKPLGGPLTAPVGFVVAEKLAATLLGNHDFVFRLLPLLAGLAAVPLMFWLGKKVLGPAGSVFSIAAFSLNWMAVFYASDLKQYSGDILFAVLIFLAAKRSFERATLRGDLLLGALGVVALTFSHPSIFILAVVGPVLLYQRRREPQPRNRIALTGAVWAITFLVLYVLFYRSVGQVNSIVGYWEDLNGLMPMPPWRDPAWFVIRSNSFFTSVVGLSPIVLIPTGLYVLGLANFIRRGQWHWSAWIFGSVLATLLGAAVANYPFKGRLIMFLIPGALLAIGEGIDALVSLLRLHPAARGLSWLLVVFLLWTPASGMWYRLRQPRSTPYPEDIKPVLQYLQDNLQPRDQIVVYSEADPTYDYYAPLYGLAQNQTYYPPDWRNQPGKYLGFIEALPRNRRIWFVFSRVLPNKNHEDERQYLLEHIRSAGGVVIQQASVAGGLSSVHLILLK